ncbi:MAG: cyclopropane fatty acyl phospholipid synthase [Candidatus Gracilibacteria bacterium]
MESAKQLVEKLLSSAGVEINGSHPWDIQVHNENLYARVLKGGTLAFGESYMDGWWDAEEIDTLITKLLCANLHDQIGSPLFLFHSALAILSNRQTKQRALKVGEVHYDLGNDLYEAMLDKNMVYTCGYWKDATDLDTAQEAKLDLVCKKIGLKEGQKILDIGCGWGSFAKFASEKYKVHVTGITIAKEQVKLARERCKGLDVDIQLMDYREMQGSFDHIISLGMFEHVGFKNYRTYMKVAQRLLADDGLFLLHTIGGNVSTTHTDPWIEKYIFPNSMLPSVKQIAAASEGLFVMEDWHNFGTNYDKTLMAWESNFRKHWNKLSNKYDERFYRMWRFYLLSCAATFRSRNNQLWQIVFSKKGVQGGYESIR